VWDSLIFRMINIDIDRLSSKPAYKEKLDFAIVKLLNHLLSILP